jgi:hypothetical protein
MDDKDADAEELGHRYENIHVNMEYPFLSSDRKKFYVDGHIITWPIFTRHIVILCRALQRFNVALLFYVLPSYQL